MKLLESLKVGEIVARNRVFMAPLTRSRGGPGKVPGDLAAEYYRQRAGSGLIITEASPISETAHGYLNTPGIYTEAQVEGWRRVVDAVHAEGGSIVIQLWHVGRISHPDHQPGGVLPVAPSAINPGGQSQTPTGMKERVTPRELRREEIPLIVNDYRHAAEMAKRAGFDGVEVHGANGYLIDQFLRTGANQRTDDYGGSVANRARFLFEVLDAVVPVWGPGRVGLRLSPSGNYHGQVDENPREIFTHVVKRLNDYPLAYAHIMRALEEDPVKRAAVEIPIAHFREVYKGVLVTNGRYSVEEAEADLQRGVADAIAFGKLWIANPDLVQRIAQGGPYNAWDATTFYTGGAKGYADYPTLDEVKATSAQTLSAR